MTERRAGWELLPRWAKVLLGLVCVFLALPAAGMTVLAIVAIVGGLQSDLGSVVPSIFAALLAGLFAWALGAVGVRMLRSKDS